MYIYIYTRMYRRWLQDTLLICFQLVAGLQLLRIFTVQSQTDKNKIYAYTP